MKRSKRTHSRNALRSVCEAWQARTDEESRNTNTNDMKQIETYLPVFPGFYNTIFEPDETDWLEENNVEWENMNFDNEEYQNDVARAVCNTMASELLDYVDSIEFEAVASPKFYNYTNDTINVKIGLTEKNIIAIGNCIADNKKDFEQFLIDRYTSCSGFISSYPNDIASWSELTSGFRVFSNDGHHLGAILEFVCEIEDVDQETLYYGDNEQVYTDMYCSLKTEEVS